MLSDCGRNTWPVIRENIDSLGCRERAVLLRMKDTAAISALKQQGDAFDLIFLDPPYRMDAAPVCAAILEAGLLREEGMIVVEHGRDTPPDVAPPLALSDRREYGAAGLSFYVWPQKDEKGETTE